MRTVIGEYATLQEAEAAVRALEPKISIQAIAIRDQSGHKWRMRDKRRDVSLDQKQRANFVVTMSGTPQNIDQARVLLRDAAVALSPNLP